MSDTTVDGDVIIEEKQKVAELVEKHEDNKKPKTWVVILIVVAVVAVVVLVGLGFRALYSWHAARVQLENSMTPKELRDFDDYENASSKSPKLDKTLTTDQAKIVYFALVDKHKQFCRALQERLGSKDVAIDELFEDIMKLKVNLLNAKNLQTFDKRLYDIHIALRNADSVLNRESFRKLVHRILEAEPHPSDDRKFDNNIFYVWSRVLYKIEEKLVAMWMTKDQLSIIIDKLAAKLMDKTDDELLDLLSRLALDRFIDTL